MNSQAVAAKLYCLEPNENPRLVLRTLPIPQPKAGKLLVRVEATSVNPIDAKRATGYGQRLLKLKGAGRFPLVLGNDFAGVVEAVGPGLSHWQPGDRVFGVLPTGKEGGAHGTHVLVDARLVRSAPPHSTASALAVFPYTFTTLWLALRGAGITPDKARGLKVLVNGASGGLGTLARQVLKQWGASVTAICSTENIELCRTFGVAQVWDRKRQKLEDLPAHFDASLNFGAWQDEHALIGRLASGALGHATTVHPLLGNFDKYGWIGGALRSRRDYRCAGALAAAKGASYTWTVFKPEEEALDALHQMLVADTLHLAVGCEAPLPEAIRAFEHVTSRRIGRAVLTIPTPPKAS